MLYHYVFSTGEKREQWTIDLYTQIHIKNTLHVYIILIYMYMLKTCLRIRYVNDYYNTVCTLFLTDSQKGRRFSIRWYFLFM